MKNQFFLIAFIALCISANGQIAQSELYGKWKVQRVVKKSSNPEFRGLLDGFRKATFNFQEDGTFHLSTESKAPTFQMMLKITKNTQWKFDANEQLIRIGREEDGYSIMGIYPTKKETSLLFALDESEMVFEVVQVQ